MKKETSKISSICNVLAGLIQYYTPDATNLGPLEPNGHGVSGASNEKEKAIQVIVNNMETFQKILERNPNDGSENIIDTVFGKKVQLIGSWRLRVMDIIQKLILLEDQDIYEKISDLNILKIISVSFYYNLNLRIKSDLLYNNLLTWNHINFILGFV